MVHRHPPGKPNGRGGGGRRKSTWVIYRLRTEKTEKKPRENCCILGVCFGGIWTIFGGILGGFWKAFGSVSEGF